MDTLLQYGPAVILFAVFGASALGGILGYTLLHISVPWRRRCVQRRKGRANDDCAYDEQRWLWLKAQLLSGEITSFGFCIRRFRSHHEIELSGPNVRVRLSQFAGLRIKPDRDDIKQTVDAIFRVKLAFWTGSHWPEHRRVCRYLMRRIATDRDVMKKFSWGSSNWQYVETAKSENVLPLRRTAS